MLKCFVCVQRYVMMDNLEELEKLYQLSANYDYETIWHNWYN